MASEDIWTIRAALDWTSGYLERKGDTSPRLSAQWLMSAATGLERIELYANFDRPLSRAERDRLREYVSRRGTGEPLQYIIGETGFRYLTLKVRPGVLIPRPETEVLVSETLSLLPSPPRRRAADEGVARAGQVRSEIVRNPHVLDDLAPADAAALERALGLTGSEAVPEEGSASPAERTEADGGTLLVADICTGSGCIACSIASEHPATRVIACDIAPEAVDLARENVADLGLDDRVTVLLSDLGEAIDPALLGTFDAVVSNPPYVPTAVLADIPREVTAFEPMLALDGGADGLALYRRLLAFARDALKPGGVFACELHETCLDEARALAEASGYVEVRIHEDLAGRPRVITTRAPRAGASDLARGAARSDEGGGASHPGGLSVSLRP